jgi:hypothetical protein
MFLSLAAALFALGGSDRKPDVVTLQGGAQLEGYVIYEDDSSLVLRVGSRERRLELKDVAEVRSATRSLAELFAALDAHPPVGAAAYLDLARFCRMRSLEGECALFAWGAIASDPGCAEAHELLGHRKRGSTWSAPESGRWYPLERLTELRRDWGRAWELSTTHYRLRTNLPLREALDAALDLERGYRIWFALFGRDLRMEDVIEPLEVEVHADSASYPESTGRGAYYDSAGRILQVDASGGFDRGALVHEAVHQLLAATAESPDRSPSGSVPGWLDEGLAELVRAGCTGAPGALRFDPTGRDQGHFALHRAERKPYDLSRVLNFNAGDFAASSRADLKYAQAYTLVDFCMSAEEGRYRPSFVEFLRGVWRGQSSSTHFKNALGLKDNEIERAWKAWVAERP